jgi:hypothetical protein
VEITLPPVSPMPKVSFTTASLFNGDDSDIEIAAGIGRGEQNREKQYQSKNDPDEPILCPSET